MAEYNKHNPSKADKQKYDLVYDAYLDHYVKRDGSDSPPPNFKVNEYTSKDGMRKEFSRGAPITPEGEAHVRNEKLAYDGMFGGNYEEHDTSNIKPNRGMKRLLFGKWTG